MRWIPCSERLPEADVMSTRFGKNWSKPKLVVIDDECYMVAQYNPDGGRWSCAATVTKWMPLPPIQ